MAAFYTFEDLSGSSTAAFTATDNPYEDLIQSCHNDPAQIQTRYATHRTNRNAQQKAILLAPDFSGVTVDEILAKLENPVREPGFQDWRHCLVFWARPPARVRTLIAEVQQRLRTVVPHLWLMAPSSLHMTALEITHSLRADEIEPLVALLTPELADMTDYTLGHRARLVKPRLSFDRQALALSFLPAASGQGPEAYTYHHLRRDLFTLAQDAGVQVASRYVIPSAHLTIGRFITKTDFETEVGVVDREKVRQLVAVIEDVNEWLEREYWAEGEDSKHGGDWTVGEEKGLECRKGTLWYGFGGETVRLGKGF